MKAFVPLLVTLLIQAFSALGMMAVPVLIPAEPGAPRLAAAGIGLYLLCAYVGAMVGSLSAGPIVDRWGAIRTSQCALLLSAAGLVLAAVFPGALLPAAVLMGLGYGPITPASSHVLIQTTPAQQRNLVFSIKQTGVPVGVALAGFCIPPLAVATGWAWTLLILALACAAVAASACPIQADLDAQTSARTSPLPPSVLSLRSVLWQLIEPLAVFVRHKGLRSLAAVSFVLSGIQISFTGYLVSYLTTGLAVTALVAGSVLGVSQLGGVMGRIVWGYASDRFIRPLSMLALLALVVSLAALATASLVLWPAPPSSLVLAGVMFVFGASASGWNGIYLAEVARQAPPGAAGKATSGALACTFLGVIVGSPVFGLIVSGTGGFTMAFGMQAMVALGAALLLFAHKTRKLRPTSG